eukprot:262284-Pleurochrysis_carterae.AAC.4
MRYLQVVAGGNKFFSAVEPRVQNYHNSQAGIINVCLRCAHLLFWERIETPSIAKADFGCFDGRHTLINHDTAGRHFNHVL